MDDSFEQVIQQIKDVVADIQTRFDDPEDDWQPVCVLRNSQRAVTLPMEYQSDLMKDIYAQVMIPSAIKALGAWMIVLVQSVWAVALEPSEENEALLASGEMVMPSQHPDRKEAVLLTAVSADQLQVWSAAIQRSEDAPPTLGSWELYPTGSDRFTGRFIDPIIEAMQVEN